MKKIVSLLLAFVLMFSITSVSYAVYKPSPSRENFEIKDEDVPLTNLPSLDSMTMIVFDKVSTDGDKVSVNVTSDKISSAIVESQENLTNIITIVPVVESGETTLNAKVNLNDIKSIVENTDVSLAFDFCDSVVIFSNDALASIAKQSEGKDVTFNMKSLEPEVGSKLLENYVLQGIQGNDCVIEVNIYSANKKISSFDDGAVYLYLPVNNDTYYVDESYYVMQISDNGVVNQLIGVCDLYNGQMCVKIATTHLSTFVVLENLVVPEQMFNWVDNTIEDDNIPLVESPKTCGNPSEMSFIDIIIEFISDLFNSLF